MRQTHYLACLKLRFFKRRKLTVKFWIKKHLPGLALTFGLAIAATSLHKLTSLSVLSPLILAILLGIALNNTIGLPSPCQPGVLFSLKKVLRLAIVLLGIQLSLSQLMEVGSIGLTIVLVTLIGTFIFTLWLGKNLGVSPKLAQLIGVGTSICGVSAVVATSAAIESSDEDVTYAIAMVTALGTISMLVYPLLSTSLQLTPQAFGIWCGASIHEIAQAIAAAFQHNSSSGEMASIAKLSRVIFLAPMVSFLSFSYAQSGIKECRVAIKQLPIPWFVLGFILLAGVNSLQIVPEAVRHVVIQITQFLLTVSLTAMGLVTSLDSLKRSGMKPLYLAIASWLFISVLSLTLIKIFVVA
jgi:uncharacterized integral membrane protein (TIGR00698 family)